MVISVPAANPHTRDIFKQPTHEELLHAGKYADWVHMRDTGCPRDWHTLVGNFSSYLTAHLFSDSVGFAFTLVHMNGTMKEFQEPWTVWTQSSAISTLRVSMLFTKMASLIHSKSVFDRPGHLRAHFTCFFSLLDHSLHIVCYDIKYKPSFDP